MNGSGVDGDRAEPSNDDGPRFAGEVDPTQAWAALSADDGCEMIDVRTTAEMAFVGAADLSSIGKRLHHIEWTSFPDGSNNPRFFEDLAAVVDACEARKVFFICRSGARSLRAATAAADLLAPRFEGRALDLVNVAEGFEGDLDAHRRRGRTNGWKARELPWAQS